jgi:hypothetical protein
VMTGSQQCGQLLRLVLHLEKFFTNTISCCLLVI